MTIALTTRVLRPIAAFRMRNAVRPIRSSTATLFSRTRTDATEGQCGSCGRHDSWHEHLGYYVCASCGQDPVEHAETV